MLPAWTDGARLLVEPAKAALLRCGDCIVFESNGTLLAHRLIRRKSTSHGFLFQTKADASPVAEPWLAQPAVIGRVVAAQEGPNVRRLDAFWASRRQQLTGLRQRFRSAQNRFLSRIARGRSGTTEPLFPANQAAQRRMVWAKNTALLDQLVAIARRLNSLGSVAVLLKGSSLIAQGIADSSEREMGDLDLLVEAPQAFAVVDALLTGGFRIHGPANRLRSLLDDQITLQTPQGSLLDLHWGLVTGGWRFREVIRVDYDGLWQRAGKTIVGGAEAAVLSPEDQWLHLCMHLILSGATGLKWWQDLARVLEHPAARPDWAAVVERAGYWRTRTIVWLSLDTLWRRWGVCVPVPVVQALRPALWRRWALRRLLAQRLGEADVAEGRVRRHLRELLLMDCLRDRLRLLWRWTHPPRAWHKFHNRVSDAA